MNPDKRKQEMNAMPIQTHSLLTKISVLIAGEEVTLTLADALMAGCFTEDALSAEEAGSGSLPEGAPYG